MRRKTPTLEEVLAAVRARGLPYGFERLKKPPYRKCWHVTGGDSHEWHDTYIGHSFAYLTADEWADYILRRSKKEWECRTLREIEPGRYSILDGQDKIGVLATSLVVDGAKVEISFPDGSRIDIESANPTLDLKVQRKGMESCLVKEE